MKLHTLSLGTNADGRLELFGLTSFPSNQSLWHRWQTTGVHWSPWTLYGGHDLHRAVVGRNQDGRLEVLALGSDKTLYHKWQVAPNDGWSPWTSLGGSPAKEIAVAANADGRLEAFAVDASTGRVKHCWQVAPNGAWGAWDTFSSAETTCNRLIAGQNADGRIEVFAALGDRSIHHTWQVAPNAEWSPWASLRGHVEGSESLSLERDPAGRLRLFTGFGNVMHIAQTAPNDGWGQWTEHGRPGGFAARRITSAQNADGRLEVFALVSPSGDVYHMWQTSLQGTWSQWFSLGASSVETIVCGRDFAGCLQLFAIGGDGRVYKVSQTEANGDWGSWTNMGSPFSFDALPESATEEAKKFAVVFDFDTDSCYPSPAVSTDGEVNPGIGVTGIDSTYVSGCRDPIQLENSNTYYRRASIRKNGVEYAVHMYALYFMKDKDLPGNQAEGGGGHRHDWEFALVWTTNGELTHASYSHHGKVTTKKRQQLYFDNGAIDHVKIVYHKNSITTHCMRFAKENERAENHLGRWLTPSIVDWHTMNSVSMSNQDLRKIFNEHDFGEANCSFNDHNFPGRISRTPPDGYPSKNEWKAVAEAQ